MVTNTNDRLIPITRRLGSAEVKNPSLYSLVLENESFQFESGNYEVAILLLEGEARAEFHNEQFSIKRSGWKDENPSVFHLCSGEKLSLSTDKKSRFIVMQTENLQSFPSKFYAPEDVQTEHRGEGILNNTCYRLVRTVFDNSKNHKNAKLILGEVLNFPGSWSSYPPHHHEQDEIYYYEMDPSEGFGFGQCGEDVYKIRHGDLLCISGGKDHSQVSAPGYTMFYIWVIQQEATPYTGFEFTKPYDKVLNA